MCLLFLTKFYLYLKKTTTTSCACVCVFDGRRSVIVAEGAHRRTVNAIEKERKKEKKKKETHTVNYFKHSIKYRKRILYDQTRKKTQRKN